MKKITCYKCKKEIIYKDDISIIGKFFIPYHNKCFKEARENGDLQVFMTFYKINNKYFYINIFFINLMMILLYLFHDNFSFYNLTIGILLINPIFLGIKSIMYFQYERYLK